MAVAVVQEWRQDVTDRSTTNYDALTARLQRGDPIDGRLVHAAGFTPAGFRIFEVWESEEQFHRFVRDRLVPLLADLGAGEAPQPETELYELHAFVAD